MVIKMTSLSISDIIPVLNMFKMLTAFEEYTIAIGGVVEGMALDIDAAKPAAIIGGIGLKPAPIAREAARGHIITAEAVLDEAYDITNRFWYIICKTAQQYKQNALFLCLFICVGVIGINWMKGSY
jgi:hypothetical protein